MRPAKDSLEWHALNMTQDQAQKRPSDFNLHDIEQYAFYQLNDHF